MYSNLTDGNLDQGHPLPPLEQLAEHLRDLILIHWENDSDLQPRLISRIDSNSLILTKSTFVRGGKHAGKSYMLFNLKLAKAADADRVIATIGLELVVRTIK